MTDLPFSLPATYDAIKLLATHNQERHVRHRNEPAVPFGDSASLTIFREGFDFDGSRQLCSHPFAFVPNALICSIRHSVASCCIRLSSLAYQTMPLKCSQLLSSSPFCFAQGLELEAAGRPLASKAVHPQLFDWTPAPCCQAAKHAVTTAYAASSEIFVVEFRSLHIARKP